MSNPIKVREGRGEVKMKVFYGVDQEILRDWDDYMAVLI